VKDPATYLNAQGIGLPSIVDPARPAVIDRAHMTLVNHEIYFFADLEEKSAFDRDPRPWMGIITDPVDRVRFRAGDDPPRFAHDGRTYFFSSPRTLAAFETDPARYADPDYSGLMDPPAGRSGDPEEPPSG